MDIVRILARSAVSAGGGNSFVVAQAFLREQKRLKENDAPSQTRTGDLAVNSRTLYRLSYGGRVGSKIRCWFK